MYKKPENADDLSRTIADLELVAAGQKREMEKTFAIVSENLKPANLVKSGVRSVLSGTHNDELINILIGLGTGFISRKAGQVIDWVFRKTKSGSNHIPSPASKLK
jgi:hypothetical protein